MQALASAEILSSIMLLICMFGIMGKRQKEKSAYMLIGVCSLSIIGCLADAACNTIYGPEIPNALVMLFWLISYSLGNLSLIMFINYWYFYIYSRAPLHRMFVTIPSAVLSACFIYSLYLGFTGRIVTVENGIPTITGGMPKIVSAIHLLTIAYFPLVAFSKRKIVGLRAVFFLGCFSIIPFMTSLGAFLWNWDDYSYPSTAIAFIAIYVFLENRNALEQEQEHSKLLAQKNIELEENKKSLESRFDIISSMSSIYFASYYIDLRDFSFVELKTLNTIKNAVNTERNAQKLLDITAEKLILPEHRDKMEKFFDLSTINERLKDKNVTSVEYVGVTTGWSLALVIAGDRDEDGNLIHIFFAGRTIHDEKERELKQIRKTEEYNRIITDAGMGVWHIFLKDGEEPRMLVNEKMAELLGITGKPLTEQETYHSWHDRITPEALDSVEASVREMIRGKVSENTYLWNHPTKGNIYVRCGGKATKLDDGTIVLGGYHADVTELVLEEQQQKERLANAQKQAEAASNAKSTFLLNMSHDIRTPMNAIVGYTELILKDMDNRERNLDYLKKIQSSSDFLLSLINNVLEMARIESGKTILEESVVAHDELPREISATYEGMMKEKGIDFTCLLDVKSKYLYVDKVKIKEIYLNLLSNAYKYTPVGGKISMVTTELPGDRPGYTVIQSIISDTGIGMSKEYLPTIFEEFSRERNTTANSIQGTGLGMPIVKKLVELMDGTITVDSAVGSGTTFVVTIPHRIASEQDYKGVADYETDTTKKYEGKRALLAEDNDLNAEIAGELLTGMGFMVERAVDGINCIDMLQKNEDNYYDVVFMDIQMPNMDGYKATQIIRGMNDKYRRSIPIIAMTANAFEQDKKQAYIAGMDAHISKPIRTAKLAEALSMILR